MKFRERIDIYLNGRDGARELTASMLLSWRVLMPACGRFGEALVEFLASIGVVTLVILTPFFFWLAPVISIFTAHRYVSDEEVRARLRRNMHRNGSGK